MKNYLNKKDITENDLYSLPSHPAFEKGGILANDLEEISFRIDFYSQPFFLSPFLERLHSLFNNRIGKFTYSILTPYQREIVNIDSVADALNESIDVVTTYDVYTYYNLNHLFSPLDEENDMRSMLFVSSNYICFYSKGVLINNAVIDFLEAIYVLFHEKWKENMVSPVDLQIQFTCHSMIEDNAFLKAQTFNGFHYIKNKELSFIKKIWCFYNPLESTIENILSWFVVDNDDKEFVVDNDDKEKVNQKSIVWDNKIVGVGSISLTDFPECNNFFEIWNCFCNNINKNIESCVNYTN